MTEKGFIASVEGGVITEAAFFINMGRALAFFQHFLRHQKSFVRDIFFGCLMQFRFEEAEKIAFADEKLLRDLTDVVQGAEVIVDIRERLFQERGSGGRFFGKRGAGKAEIIKKLAEQMGEQFFKGLRVTDLVVIVCLAKDITCDDIIGKVDNFHTAGNQAGTLHAVSFFIKENIVPLVIHRRVDLDEMILQRADKHEITLFQLVALALDDMRSIPFQKENELIHTVRMHGISIAGDLFRFDMIVVNILTFGDVIVHREVCSLCILLIVYHAASVFAI